VQPETWTALEQHAPDAEYVGPLDTALGYYSLLAGLWAGGEGFAIVEHDVVIHAGVIPGFVGCSQPWCSFPYSGGYTLFTEGLGCARFSGALTQRLPSLIDDIDDRSWFSLDSMIAVALHAAGYKVHVHQPPVLHAHRWRPPPAHQQPCPCPTCVWVAGVIP
jgi:hypothetical protein